MIQGAGRSVLNFEGSWEPRPPACRGSLMNGTLFQCEEVNKAACEIVRSVASQDTYICGGKLFLIIFCTSGLIFPS